MSKSEPQALLQELTRLETLRDPSFVQSKRQFERFVIRADAELHPMDRSRHDQSPVPILLRDISRGGMGFVCSEPLSPDSTWHVSFTKDGYIIGSQAVIVRHCRLIKETTYLAGAQFCISSGLLAQLGIKASSLRDSDQSVSPTADAPNADPFDDQDNFRSPDDL